MKSVPRTDVQNPIPITTVGASTGGSVLFRKDGKLQVTCVVKSTFRLVPDKPMQCVAAEEIIRSEVHYRNNPMRSICTASEMAPYLPRVDVILTGHAYAPSGQSVQQLDVRLALYHSIALLDKKLLVVGERRGSEILPFESMPLVYEKALGGIGDPVNPYGTGMMPGAAPPNIVDPKNAQAVVGFGPISRALRQRKVLRGNVSLAQLDEALIELPANFDWNYFQAAPPDQQVASLMGNEWIVLEGMHPTLPRLTSRLPTLHPIAKMFGFDPAKPDATQLVHPRIDIVRIDADALTCSVVARAVVPIEDERLVATIRFAAAIETEEETYAHLLVPPTMTAAYLGATARVVPGESKPEGGGGTLVLGDSPSEKQAVTFSAQKTFDIEDASTIDMDIASHHAEGTKPATPFAAPGPKRASGSRKAPIPGAPWSPVSASPTKPSRGRHGTMTEVTHTTSDEPTHKFARRELIAAIDAPPPPQIPPMPVPATVSPAKPLGVIHTTPVAPPEPPPAPAAAEGPPKDLWGKTGNELPIVMAKPPPPKLPAKPAVNKAIYGGFGPPKKKT